MQKLNNKGPRIDPCGTPWVTFNADDMDVPIRWYECSYSSVLLSIVKVAGRMEKHWPKKYNMKTLVK